MNQGDLLSVMSGFGYPPERLHAEAALLDQLEAKRFQQRAKTGKAMVATQQRDKAIGELVSFDPLVFNRLSAG